jgi:hypothetical protein
MNFCYKPARCRFKLYALSSFLPAYDYRRNLRGQQQRISGRGAMSVNKLGNTAIGFHIRQGPTQFRAHSRQGIGYDKLLLSLFIDKRQ